MPVHLVPSISHSFHDGIACVAARMSPVTFSLNSRGHEPLADDLPPPLWSLMAFVAFVAFVVVQEHHSHGAHGDESDS
jgi:hypothetical protein